MIVDASVHALVGYGHHNHIPRFKCQACGKVVTSRLGTPLYYLKSDLFNAFVAERHLPLVIFHDHFLGQLGGVAIFFIENPDERDVLQQYALLTNWLCQLYPLIYAFNPAAFDEQVAYTLRRYRDVDWQTVRYGKTSAVR